MAEAGVDGHLAHDIGILIQGQAGGHVGAVGAAADIVGKIFGVEQLVGDSGRPA